MAGGPGSGPQRGRPQPHRRVSYDPSKAQVWRTGLSVPPEEASKAIKAADAADMSFAGLVAELIRRMPVDADGRPTWAPKPKQRTQQEELPRTG